MRTVHILVVEDNPVNQKLLEILLRALRYRVTLANTGEGAIAKCRSATEDFDIIFMDIHMPGMTGLDAARFIRREGLSNAPVVAFSADETIACSEQLCESGIDDLLRKPYSFNQVIEIINRWVDRRAGP